MRVYVPKDITQALLFKMLRPIVWQGLEFKLSPEAEQLCLTAVKCELGDGRNLKFWTSGWLDGRSIADLAPHLMEFVSSEEQQSVVADVLPDHRWVAGIRGRPSIPAIAEFMDVWELVSGHELGVEADSFTWRLTTNGNYSSKSAYGAFFLGREGAPGAAELWSSKAPLLHKLHGWFTLRGRLWTADRLARRGMDHPDASPLCCQEPETTEHLTMRCPFAREVWYTMLLAVRLHRFTPTDQAVFVVWWGTIAAAVPRDRRKDLNAMITLVARCLWLERNSRVFDKIASLPWTVCRKIREEWTLWRRAKLCGVDLPSSE